MKENEKKKHTSAAQKEMRKKSDPTNAALSVIHTDEDSEIITDPQGSWTGVPRDRYDYPVQDADDL